MMQTPAIMEKINQVIRPAVTAWMLPVVSLLLSIAPAEAQFTFTTNNGAITITGTYVTYGGHGIALTIPSSTNGYPVTGIGTGAFSLYNMTSLLVPDSVTNIGIGAFSGSSMTNISLGSGVLNIGPSAFSGCEGLRNILIPNNVKNLGSSAFVNCANLTNVILGTGITSISPNVFQNCTGLRTVTLPNGLISIGEEAFQNSGLTRINIPDSVTNIDGWAFYNDASLTNVTIGSGVTNIGISAFAGNTNAVSFYFKGGPPGLGGALVNVATINYLPGATGWGTNFGGQPTLLWNPQAQTMDGLFGIRTNRFGFNITGTTNISLAVEASTNLVAGGWTVLQTFTLTNGACYFSDPQWKTNGPARYYRIRSP